jgi:hypothetical protein
VKLSEREIELISNIAKHRKQRKTAAWILLWILLAGFAVAIYFRLDALILVLAVLSGFAASESFGLRPESRIEELLLKYVNNDAETIRQISERSKPGESAV